MRCADHEAITEEYREELSAEASRVDVSHTSTGGKTPVSFDFILVH